MKCYKCGRQPIAYNLSMYPIDPKGTEGRRWVCTKCEPKENDEVINDIVSATSIAFKDYSNANK